MTWGETISQVAIALVALIQIAKLVWVNPKVKKKLDDVESQVQQKLPDVVDLAQKLEDLKNAVEKLKNR